MKFTEEIKNRWLEALKSGKYTPTEGKLRRVDKDGKYKHCCLGVLAEVYGKEFNSLGDNLLGKSAYEGGLGLDNDIIEELYIANDSHVIRGGKDYKTVIPIIEQLETTD